MLPLPFTTPPTTFPAAKQCHPLANIKLMMGQMCMSNLSRVITPEEWLGIKHHITYLVLQSYPVSQKMRRLQQAVVSTCMDKF